MFLENISWSKTQFKFNLFKIVLNKCENGPCAMSWHRPAILTELIIYSISLLLFFIFIFLNILFIKSWDKNPVPMQCSNLVWFPPLKI